MAKFLTQFVQTNMPHRIVNTAPPHPARHVSGFVEANIFRVIGVLQARHAVGYRMTLDSESSAL